MHNTEGTAVDLYIPRKWCAASRPSRFEVKRQQKLVIKLKLPRTVWALLKMSSGVQLVDQQAHHRQGPCSHSDQHWASERGRGV